MPPLASSPVGHPGVERCGYEAQNDEACHSSDDTPHNLGSAMLICSACQTSAVCGFVVGYGLIFEHTAGSSNWYGGVQLAKQSLPAIC